MISGPNPAVRAAALLVALFAAACQSVAPPATPSTPARSSGPLATPTPFVKPSIGPNLTAAPATSDPQLDHIVITLQPFATVPGAPLAMAAPDDGTGRLFVVDQTGSIWIVDASGSTRSEPLVNLDALVRSGGEQGLLGLALHPRFPMDPRAFVNYTNRDGDTIVASLSLDPANHDRLDPASHKQLLFVDQPFANHNGGAVLFGPEGKLYLSLGDGGSGGDPRGNGQNTDALLGKILRIDVDGAAAGPYIVPPDNPFANGGGAPEIWHWGMRNPWRMSFDRATGDLWIGDVGQDAWEEVDVSRTGVGGLNFGWNAMEGSHCYNGRTCDSTGLTFPVAEYGHDLGCTVIGGYVYRGTRYPFLVGTYLLADYCTGTIFAIDAATNGVVKPVVVGAGGSEISAFGEDVDGELYVTHLGGDVSRVVAKER
jgi:glucose/arabinose dehydrogenase